MRQVRVGNAVIDEEVVGKDGGWLLRSRAGVMMSFEALVSLFNPQLPRSVRDSFALAASLVYFPILVYIPFLLPCAQHCALLPRNYGNGSSSLVLRIGQ